MVGIKRVHHWFAVVRHIKVWHLCVALVVGIVLSVFFLRQNNLQMVELREQVKAADEAGQNVEEALLNLQHYVSGHMNTSLGDGIALQHTYQRAYTRAIQQAASSTNPNAALYAQAELECRPVFERTNSFPAYTYCAQERLSQLSPGQDALSTLSTPPPDAYRFNFISPIWSPDIAGFLVLFTLIIGFLLLLRLLIYTVLWLVLRFYK